MMKIATSYPLTFLALGALFLLSTLQVLIEGNARHRAGIAPGTSASADGRPFPWRVERARINTSDHVPLFVGMVLTAMLLGVPAHLEAGLACSLAVLRIGFTCFYYLDKKTPRSATFMLGSIVTAAQAITVVIYAVIRMS